MIIVYVGHLANQLSSVIAGVSSLIAGLIG